MALAQAELHLLYGWKEPPWAIVVVRCLGVCGDASRFVYFCLKWNGIQQFSSTYKRRSFPAQCDFEIPYNPIQISTVPNSNTLLLKQQSNNQHEVLRHPRYCGCRRLGPAPSMRRTLCSFPSLFAFAPLLFRALLAVVC